MKKKKNVFTEHDVRLHYRLLNHRHLTELRFLKRGMYPACRIVKDEDAFVAVCQQWNEKRNIYVGLRDRREGLRSCGKTEDIVGLQAVVLDIDPIREAETPSTKKELNTAIEVGTIIKKWFVDNGYKEPCIAVTGNGCCLYCIMPFHNITDKNRFAITRSIERFEVVMRDQFKNILKDYNCTIDRMYDLPRIIRVIGTCNIKGESTSRRPHRLSYWHSKPKERQEDKKLLHFILHCKE
jgi:hypothetical protein